MIIRNNKYSEELLFDDSEVGALIAAAPKLEPADKYPGVSKVLNATNDMSFLAAWKARVGEEEAERIVNESVQIGKSFDMLMFEYFKGSDVENMVDEVAYKLYSQSLKHLKHIQPIALQLKVFSDKLKMQGYIDMLCYYKGELTLLDFKNSAKYKHDDHLESYYKQCTFYCMMLYDMYGITVKQLVLFIGMRKHVYPDIRISKAKYFVKDCVEANKNYYCT